jgi:hypothetical protein
MSYQASIEHQFEFIQKNWVNSPKFPGDESVSTEAPDVGIDPIIGQNSKRTGGGFAIKWGETADIKTASFEQFVHLRGGEYFFAPSMQFLKRIDEVNKINSQNEPLIQ